MAVDLANLNLNLVRSLHELLRARSVTVAAQRCGVTQSAMSHALKQLRLAFEDPLLVRSGRGMLLTPRAERLAVRIGPGLDALQSALGDDPEFDPSTSERSFRLTSGDYLATTFLPALLGILRDEAPGVDLDVATIARGLDEGHDAERFERGESDLFVGAMATGGPGLQRRLLYRERFACLVREDHPEVGRRLTLARYVRLGHARITTTGRGTSIVDQRLTELGRRRRVVLRVGSFLAAPVAVASSDLVLTAPAGLALHFAEHYPLRVLPPPLELPGFDVIALWHERMQADPGHAWLRATVARAARAYRDAHEARARAAGLPWAV